MLAFFKGFSLMFVFVNAGVDMVVHPFPTIEEGIREI